MIDILCDQAAKEDIAVAGLYCDFFTQQEQTVTNMLGAILKQLVGGGDIPEHLREAFQEGKRRFGGRGLRLPDLMKLLRITIASLPQVFICLDALDECLPKQLPGLLGSLRDIIKELPRTRVLLTGRPHVTEDIRQYFTKAVVIPVSPNKDDIRSYLEMRLDMDAEPDAMNNDLRADIMRTILERVSDMCVGAFTTLVLSMMYLQAVLCRFLLVSLHIDAILGEVTIRQRRKKLEQMTRGNGLGDAYAATLTRIKAQKGNKSILGLKVLMWLSYSERPLRAEELCHALGAEMGSTDLDLENVPALRTLLASSLGLVAVESSSSTVRLVHFTLHEHLLSDPMLFHNPDSAIAEVCLTYLNFQSVRDLSPTLRSAPATMPLLEYASLYWANHTRMGMTDDVKILALRLLDGFEKHISAQLVLLDYGKHGGSGLDFSLDEGPRGFTGLHGTAFLGIVGIIEAVLEMKEWDVNATDSIRSTAPIFPAGRLPVKLWNSVLGRFSADRGQAYTIYGRTPLFWAAERGHEGVVKMLLDQEDINPSQTETGWTPLLLAVERGHEGVVKLLLERESVNPNQADTKYGQTPLLWATERGYEGVVRMLLDREGVNPDQADSEYGRTPLSWAAKRGHEGVVKMLLDREGVNPDHEDIECGRTPLSFAAGYGHKPVVKMLLDQEGVNPNHVDNGHGWTPLSWAAENGREEVVKMLLDRDDVNPNHVDSEYGRTPLLSASRRGAQHIVNIILKRKDVRTDIRDTESQAPLSPTLSGGRGGIVRLLSERDNVNSNTVDHGSQASHPLPSVHGDNRVAQMQPREDHPNTHITDPSRKPTFKRRRRR